MHTYPCMHTHTRAHACAHAHTHTYTHTHTHCEMMSMPSTLFKDVQGNELM